MLLGNKTLLDEESGKRSDVLSDHVCVLCLYWLGKCLWI